MREITWDYRTKVITLLSIFGALCLTAALGWVFSQQAVAQRQAAEPLFTQPLANVTGLELGEVVLKKSSSWELTFKGKAYPASADRIETYLKTLSTLQRERLVTNGDGVTFGLGEGFKTVKLQTTGGKALVLQVGSPNDLGDKVYVRWEGEKNIYETDRGFSRTLELDFNTWADLTLFPGRKAADLTRITFTGRIETADKTVYEAFDVEKVLADGKSSWQNRLTKASTATLGSWAELVAPFRFGAFVSPGEAPAGNTLGTVVLAWADGSTSTLTIGAPDAQNRYRVTDGTKDFWVNDWALGQLLYKG